MVYLRGVLIECVILEIRCGDIPEKGRRDLSKDVYSHSMDILYSSFSFTF